MGTFEGLVLRISGPCRRAISLVKGAFIFLSARAERGDFVKRKLLSLAAIAALYPVVQASSASAAISDIYDDGVGSFGSLYTGLNGVVTSVLSTSGTTNTFTVQDTAPGDQSASVIAYSISKTAYTAVVGDNITFNAYDAGYQDAPELTASTGVNAFTVTSVNSHLNAFTPPVLTIPQTMTAGTGYNYTTSTTGAEEATYPYSEAIVTLDDVIFNGSTPTLSTTTNTAYYVNDGQGNGIELYDYKSDTSVLAAVTAADAANPGGFTQHEYDITGYVDVYYGEAELYPLSITAVPEPASLSVLALGSVGLLSRRRRKA